MKIGSLVRYIIDKEYEPYGLQERDVEETNLGIVVRLIDIHPLKDLTSHYAMVYWIYEYRTTPHMAINLECLSGC
jgi:hypothetical protein